MTEFKEVTCERCQNACKVTVEVVDGEIVSVSGNGCMRGEVFAKNKIRE